MSQQSIDGSVRPKRVCPVCRAYYDGEAAFCPLDGSPLIHDGPSGSQIGLVLGDRYRLVRKLGEGGMGTVYEAEHVYIDKKFAIKLLKPEITGEPEAVARFHQEARSASTIGHDNIVSVDDFGRLPDGRIYLAMEYLEGEALAARMARGPVLLSECVAIAAELCDGLAAAHEKGIVHRDMKPANIFLQRKSGRTRVKILDFGIAKITAGSTSQRLTRTGAVYGTPHYMSPEQALGNAIDHRADIYSVGVILYELTTGRVPFDAESFLGILTQHLTQLPKPPRAVAPERAIPEALETLVLKAMAKEAAARFQTMQELAAALLEVARNQHWSTQLERVAADSVRVAAPAAPIAAGSSGADHEFTAAATVAAAQSPSRELTPIPPARTSGGASAASVLAAADAPAPADVVAGASDDALAPRRRRSGWLIGVVALVVLALAAGVVLRHRWGDERAAATTAPPAARQQPPAASSPVAPAPASALPVTAPPVADAPAVQAVDTPATARRNRPRAGAVPSPTASPPVALPRLPSIPPEPSPPAALPQTTSEAVPHAPTSLSPPPARLAPSPASAIAPRAAGSSSPPPVHQATPARPRTPTLPVNDHPAPHPRSPVSDEPIDPYR